MDKNTLIKTIDGLNSQGYLFQQRCVHEVKNIDPSIGWKVNVKEYPVAIYEKETEIDFILHNQSYRTYAIVECKRAHPNYLIWVFTDVEKNFKTFQATHLVIREIREGRHVYRNGQPTHLRPQSVAINISLKEDSVGIASYGLEIFTKEYKNKKPARPDTISDACYQVFMGLGGFVLEQQRQLEKFPDLVDWIYIPIVITTANLYIVEYSVSDIGLETGSVSIDDINKSGRIKKVPWVILSYGVKESTQITTVDETYHGRDVRDIKEKYKSKDLFIVNSLNIQSFLSKLYIGRNTK